MIRNLFHYNDTLPPQALIAGPLIPRMRNAISYTARGPHPLVVALRFPLLRGCPQGGGVNTRFPTSSLVCLPDEC